MRMVTELSNAVMKQCTVLTDWLKRVPVNAYNGKVDALQRRNHRGLKMLDQVINVQEKVPEKLIREGVEISEMIFADMPSK